ncbi:unnamed protein product, partial [Rotaria sp. Silwood2]
MSVGDISHDEDLTVEKLSSLSEELEMVCYLP